MSDTLFVFYLAVVVSATLLLTWWSGKADRSYISAAGLKVASGTCILLVLFFGALDRAPNRNSIFFLQDFANLYVGGRLVVENPAGLYDLETQTRTQAEATGLNLESDMMLPFPYPPVVAFLFSGLGTLGYRAAYRIFLVINVIALIVLVSLLSRRINLGKGDSSLLILFCLLFKPLHSTLIQGQLSMLITLVFCLYLFSLKRGSQLHAGIWAGILTLNRHSSYQLPI